ncbi:MAG TPA: hypothetical protein PLB38_02135 [bacterium]|nr:hypothetical protein [bacterium]
MESKKVEAVLSVLSFFQIFNCPLTRSEIYQGVFGEADLEFTWNDLSVVLEDLLNKDVLVNESGLYALNIDRPPSALESRLKYQATFYLKAKRARRWAFFMSLFPGVRGVAVVNSVGFKLPSDNADIDFLIITDEKSLYISRLLVTFFLKIFGLRPTKQNQKDKICTSFWLSEKNLNLEKIAYSDNDVYLYYWLLNVYPLYDQADYWERWQSANFWLKNRLPNSHFRANIKKIQFGILARFWKRLGEIFFTHRFWNNWAKKLQYRFFSSDIKELMNKDTRVIVNDEMLKFHTVDNRQKYFDLYQENLKNSLNKYRYVAKEN